ncbi:MAG: universal stress protein [Hyphomicrobiaceae bacterium]
MFKKVLVAVDGSEHAKQAVSAAGGIASKFGAQLVIMHVMKRTGSDRIPDDLKELARVEHIEVTEAEALRSVADAIVGRAKDVAGSAGAKDIVAEIGAGSPTEQIIAYCKNKDVDLIVLGRRGLSDIASLFLGSVSHNVSQFAPCACLTVPGSASTR